MDPKARDKYLQECIAYWREALNIPKEIKLRIKFVTHRDEDEARNYATITRDMIPYEKATLEIYDEVFASKDFKKDAEEAICHEMLHLALYPLVSYCNNMFTEDTGKQKHLEDVEESVVSTLERSLIKLAGRTTKNK